MKKLFICFAVLTLLLVSCTNDKKTSTPPSDTPQVEDKVPNDSTPDETVPPSQDIDTPSEPSDVEPPKEKPSVEAKEFKSFEYKITTYDWVEMKNMTPEEQTREFLSALYLGDREALDLYLQGDTVEELLKVKFKSITYSGKEIMKAYETLSGNEYEGFESDVMFEISESDSPFFPVGSYCYKLLVMSPTSFAVEYFGIPESYESFEGESIPTKASPETLLASYNFIENMFRYCNGKISMEALLADDNLDSSVFHIIIHELMNNSEDFIFEISLDGFKKHVSERLGITDEEKLNRFADRLANVTYATCDENGIYKGSCAHGYATIMRFPFTAYEDGNKQYFSYGVFADSAYTIQCAQVDFYLEKKDGAEVFTVTKIDYRDNLRENAPILTPYVSTP